MRPWRELSEDERWRELAASCLGCGLRRDPLPEVIEMWMCPRCITDFHLALGGSQDRDNRFVHHAVLGPDPYDALGRALEPPREKSLPAPVSGSVKD